MHKHGLERTRSEARLASCCCGLEVAADLPPHPLHKADVLETPAPSQAAHHSFAVAEAGVDVLPPEGLLGSPAHTHSHPRELQVQLAQNVNVAGQCGSWASLEGVVAVEVGVDIVEVVMLAGRIVAVILFVCCLEAIVEESQAVAMRQARKLRDPGSGRTLHSTASAMLARASHEILE